MVSCKLDDRNELWWIPIGKVRCTRVSSFHREQKSLSRRTTAPKSNYRKQLWLIVVTFHFVCSTFQQIASYNASYIPAHPHLVFERLFFYIQSFRYIWYMLLCNTIPLNLMWSTYTIYWQFHGIWLNTIFSVLW